ncbi:MAG: universal stress protein [Rhizobiaceae bacterium]
MAFKTLLVVVGMNQGNRDLDLSAEICEAAQAHMSVLVVSPASAIPIGTYADVVSDAWYVERQRDAKKLKDRTGDVTALIAAKNISSDVTSEYAEMALVGEVIGRRARYADVTILGPSLLADETLNENALDGALFRSGRPVLVLPEKAKATLSPGIVSIAWDGSLEAARSVGAAIGMLSQVRQVRIVLVDPVSGEGGHGAEPGADLASYLSRHGVNVTVDRLPSSGNPASDVLLQHAGDHGVEMIVMGAYGHSRLRERIFGGVTRSMLNRVTVPLFMAH